MAYQPVIYFSVDSVLERFLAAKKEGTFPHSVLEFGWKGIRSLETNSQIKYVKVLYITEDKTKYPLKLRFSHERQSGSIPPKDEADLAVLKDLNPNLKMKKREYGIAVQFNKYACRVETDDNNVVIIPNEKFRSKLFQVVEMIDLAFADDIENRKKAGLIGTLEDKIKGHMQENGLLLASTKTSRPIQTHISYASTSDNKGGPLINPILRLKIHEHRTTKELDRTFEILDLNKPILNDLGEVVKYEWATTLGPDKTLEFATSKNIHKILTSGCIHDGAIDASNICLSNMGISLSLKLTSTAIFRPDRPTALDMIYGDTKNFNINREPESTTSNENFVNPISSEIFT
nr:hypothetical protein [Abalone asfa-like virus]